MGTSVQPHNKFFDINKLPTSEGILFFGISMSLIGNKQGPQKCFDYLKHLVTFEYSKRPNSKVQYTEGIGMVMMYGDYLYFHSDNPAHELRDRFKEQMISHKNGFLNLLKKDRAWTLKAFLFTTFGQLLLDNSDVYPPAYYAVQELYKKDSMFRKYVEQDCATTGHGLGEKELHFILEEITLFYLLQKGSFRLNNKFVTDSDKNWTLQAYPGKPLKSEIYLFQKNPLNLSNPKNIYENCFYDLEEKILYDYLRTDLKK